MRRRFEAGGPAFEVADASIGPWCPVRVLGEGREPQTSMNSPAGQYITIFPINSAQPMSSWTLPGMCWTRVNSLGPNPRIVIELHSPIALRETGPAVLSEENTDKDRIR